MFFLALWVYIYMMFFFLSVMKKHPTYDKSCKYFPHLIINSHPDWGSIIFCSHNVSEQLQSWLQTPQKSQKRGWNSFSSVSFDIVFSKEKKWKSALALRRSWQGRQWRKMKFIATKMSFVRKSVVSWLGKTVRAKFCAERTNYDGGYFSWKKQCWRWQKSCKGMTSHSWGP